MKRHSRNNRIRKATLFFTAPRFEIAEINEVANSLRNWLVRVFVVLPALSQDRSTARWRQGRNPVVRNIGVFLGATAKLTTPLEYTLSRQTAGKRCPAGNVAARHLAVIVCLSEAY